MTDTLIVLHTAIAILGVVLLILAAGVEPVIALVIGSIYLGLAAGLGFEDTMTTVAGGFGDIMTEVGLLIGFGVLLGSLLFSMGALQKLVELLLRALGPTRLPYALSAVLSTVFPSIYVDVQLVLAAPLARSAAPRLGRHGIAMMGGALTAGILVGYVFVVPGLGTVSIAGLLNLPLGTMLLYGLGVGLPTAVITTFLYGRLLRLGFWSTEKDEVAAAAADEREAAAVAGASGGGGGGGSAGDEDDAAEAPAESPRTPPLPVSLLPILVPLVMIAAGAVAEAAGMASPAISFFGDPAFALFIGLLGAYLLARLTLGGERTNSALQDGLNTTGQILLVTGVGGSLGAVIGETGLEGVLAGLFSAESGTPALVAVLLAWAIAAVLHLAIGSISVAAITAAGILAPIMGSLDLPPQVLGLAIGSGALFALQVNSNFFWMFQSLLGVTTRGTLKALTFVTALASVVSLVIVCAIGLVV
ncbi:SLC13 family permease [Streptomonospora halophila]|uniref:SLC13 family permease n=1 Tax=Streptomonospora halophila TaxID=427369 RepID=A0ABP9G5W6_9ACTN